MPWLARWFGQKPVQDDSRFGYCVVGTGHGAEKMCDALRDSPHARVVAVMSSSVERARKFGKRYGIAGAYSYDQFEDLSLDLSVGAVYLALPVTLHRGFTEKAAAASKHVLCEKPMAASIADAEAMIAACAAAQKMLMIAYRLDYDPMHAEVARLLAEGALGAVKKVTSAFGIVAKPGWRLDPKMAGGGSLFDVGVYPVHAIQTLFGDVQLDSARIEQNEDELDVDVSWQGRLSNGATFECRSSYLRYFADELRITGERGWVTLEHAFAYERTELKGEFRDDAGVVHRVTMKDAKSNASLFRLEAEHLAACIREGMTLRSPGEAGLLDMRTVAQIDRIAKKTTLSLAEMASIRNG